MTVRNSIVVERAPPDVWKWIKRDRVFLWTPTLVSLDTLTGRPGEVGSTFAARFRFGSTYYDYEGEVLASVEFEHSRLRIWGGGPGRQTITYTDTRFTLTDFGHTRVDREIWWEFAKRDWVARCQDWLLHRLSYGHEREWLRRLKRIAENPPPEDAVVERPPEWS